MTDRCLSIEEILRMAEVVGGTEAAGEAADPRADHLRSCPRCRGILLSFEDFRAQATRGPQPGEDAAVTRLTERVRSLVTAGETAVTREESRNSRMMSAPRWWSPRGRSPFRFLVPAFGAAAILIGAFLTLRDVSPWSGSFDGKRTSVEREMAPATIGRGIVLETPRRLADGGVEFRWRAARNVDSYQVRLLDAGFSEVAVLEAGSAVSLTIPPGRWNELKAAEVVYWQVQGTVGGDPLADSAPTLLADSVRAP